MSVDRWDRTANATNDRQGQPGQANDRLNRTFDFGIVPRPARMSSDQTRQTILDVAETLFAELGYDACSLRTLTQRAHVNLAAVHYHFGSKEDLARAVISRRLQPCNEERLRRLDLAVTAAAPRAPAPRDILRALLEPPLRLAAEPNCQSACQMFGRLIAEQPPFVRDYLTEQFRPVLRRFAEALAAALPQLTPEELFWRLHFVVGAMAHTMQHARLLAALTDGLCDPSDIDALVDRLTVFATAGCGAPATPRRAEVPR